MRVPVSCTRLQARSSHARSDHGPRTTLTSRPSFPTCFFFIIIIIIIIYFYSYYYHDSARHPGGIVPTNVVPVVVGDAANRFQPERIISARSVSISNNRRVRGAHRFGRTLLTFRRTRTQPIVSAFNCVGDQTLAMIRFGLGYKCYSSPNEMYVRTAN